MKRYIIAALVLAVLVIAALPVSASELDEPETSEAVEVSGSTSTVQDEQTEAAAGEPIAPELPAEDMQDAQNEDERETETVQSTGQEPAEEMRTKNISMMTLAEDAEYITDMEYQLFVACGFGLVLGAVAGLSFMNKWNVGV